MAACRPARNHWLRPQALRQARRKRGCTVQTVHPALIHDRAFSRRLASYEMSYAEYPLRWRGFRYMSAARKNSIKSTSLCDHRHTGHCPLHLVCKHAISELGDIDAVAFLVLGPPRTRR